MSEFQNKKILVTGGRGFLGRYVAEHLKQTGVNEKQLCIPSAEEIDLRTPEGCAKAVREQDIVIHLAANVGGIGEHLARPGEIFFDNVMMDTHLMEAARQAGVKTFLSVGSINEYPAELKPPFRETDLWSGYPESTNASYALAKRMLIVQGEAYRAQYGFSAIHLILPNLYGAPKEEAHAKLSYVIPLFIKKISDAIKTGAQEVEVWGTGNAVREFLHVSDAAEAIAAALLRYKSADPLNIGPGTTIDMKTLFRHIADSLGFKGAAKWDVSRTEGQSTRFLDSSRAASETGFRPKIEFKTGLAETIEWYADYYTKHS